MIPLFIPSLFPIYGQKNILCYHPAAPGAIYNHSNAEFLLLFSHSAFLIQIAPIGFFD
jgi:hypothetical protein